MLQSTDRFRCCNIIIKILNLQKNQGLLQDPHTTYYNQMTHSRLLSKLALGMTALHLRIAEFKFTHNYIMCDQLLETEFIFGIDIQRKFSISYAWDKEKTVTFKKKENF